MRGKGGREKRKGKQARRARFSGHARPCRGRRDKRDSRKPRPSDRLLVVTRRARRWIARTRSAGFLFFQRDAGVRNKPHAPIFAIKCRRGRGVGVRADRRAVAFESDRRQLVGLPPIRGTSFCGRRLQGKHREKLATTPRVWARARSEGTRILPFELQGGHTRAAGCAERRPTTFLRERKEMLFVSPDRLGPNRQTIQGCLPGAGKTHGSGNADR